MTTGRIQRNPDSTWLPHSPGFSLVELLVALTICALLSGAIAAVAPQARAAFDATPEALDLLQRERTVVDVLTRALRSAALLTAARDDGTAGAAVPALYVGIAGEHVQAMTSQGNQVRNVRLATRSRPAGLPSRPRKPTPTAAQLGWLPRHSVITKLLPAATLMAPTSRWNCRSV